MLSIKIKMVAYDSANAASCALIGSAENTDLSAIAETRRVRQIAKHHQFLV